MAIKNEPAKPGAAARKKRADEVRGEQIESRLQGMTNVPEDTTAAITGSTPTGKKDVEVEFEVVGGVLFIHVGSHVVRFERAELFRLEKAVRRAKQGV